MAAASRSVFLSYASEDSEAAQRIADALRAAGVEVWFDKNELRGGEAWDQSIRRRIGECTLFVPVISANTEARREGYFRLEWRLAVERNWPILEFRRPVPASRRLRNRPAVPVAAAAIGIGVGVAIGLVLYGRHRRNRAALAQI